MTVPGLFPPKHRHQLALLALASLVGYGFFWLWFPLRPFFNVVPLQDVRTLAPSLTAGLGYGLLLLMLFVLYWLAFRGVISGSYKPSLFFLLGTAVLLALPLLQTYPINANDLYRYVIRGRITSFYGQNPYIDAPDTFPDDPFFPLAGEWANATSPYGPLWELLAGRVTGLTQDNLLAGLLSFKMAGLLGHLICGWLIWQLLARAAPKRRRSLTLLWLWNPALLLMFVVDGHNDVLMMVWQLVGIWFWRQKRPSVALLFLLLAALTKPIALLPLPFFALAIWRDLPNSRERLRVLGLTTLLGGTAVWLAFLPFGSPASLAERLLSEASSSPGFSPATLVLLIAGDLGRPVTAEFVDLVANLFRVSFGIVLVWLLWLGWQYGRSPLRGAADSLFAYSLQALSFRLWYSTWPFLFLLLDEESSAPSTSRRLLTGLYFLLTVQLSVLIYGHLRVFALNGSQLAAHLIGIPFVFLLPFLLGSLSGFSATNQPKRPHN